MYVALGNYFKNIKSGVGEIFKINLYNFIDDYETNHFYDFYGFMIILMSLMI